MVSFKRIMLLGFALFLASCNATKIEKIEKIKVLPGVSIGNTYFTYKIIVAVYKETSFKSITIKNSNKVIEKFSVVNLDSKMQGDNSTLYAKGKYSLQFNLQSHKNMNINTEDIIEIGYSQDGKLILKTAKVSETKTISLR